jgi:hypothetical protein
MNCPHLRLYSCTINNVVTVLDQLPRTPVTPQSRATHMKLINEKSKTSSGKVGGRVAFGYWLLIARAMVWLTVGSRPVRENSISQRNMLEGLKPSTSVVFPSRVTVYSGERLKSRELM